MSRRKYLTELIIEGKEPSVLDNLPEPYLFLGDDKLDRLNQAVNIVAVKKGYRVVSQSLNTSWGNVLVLMEKEKNK
jgi:hypothetical protein